MSGPDSDRNALFRKAAFALLSERFPRIDAGLQARLKETLAHRQAEMNRELMDCLQKHQNDPEGSQTCAAHLDRGGFMAGLRKQIDSHKRELHACLERSYQAFAADPGLPQEAGERQLAGCLDAFEGSLLRGQLY